MKICLYDLDELNFAGIPTYFLWRDFTALNTRNRTYKNQRELSRSPLWFFYRYITLLNLKIFLKHDFQKRKT
ncbi:hypothetical protein CHCC20488_4123 [Bacillus paralicheniformis]|uniref:Uncharacterized protein n=1 Tax=Bacillus paralicheniformis TaxID=1648923 RepID=A0ABY3FZ89_9BACI|nr:hypothetical protein CHCC20497_2646 [Bacillus paralicheniformis]TWK87939.1 hypothetical protein CHCC20331_3300 [Bacillus paralicheniformis]TWL41130.1 hypothetical protein CHCC15381_1929 [Bacillus paralicheniformis]TWN42718.1 hypothetical protein CHCC14523_0814 [Bacillus paralicheniformis]TWN85689.1 hypothetical protein CHCC20492_0948 [Bacillus paralicheniformis]